ncbi:MAG: acetylornithine deacetylase [Gammaproteobacteria bacterium]|nr:acetylornithine deacetylase [Gammaproteobacteria bacterium]
MSNNDPQSLPMIERLISFDTTSRNSNLELIEFIRIYLEDLGAETLLVYDDDKRKANLYAMLGSTERPSVVLSGHTDVVPVDGQDWDSKPFSLTRRNGRLYGRGTADMKSFIAVCLTYAPTILNRNLQTPIHFAFSYDEEVGCAGVPRLLDKLAQFPVKPRACIIGEPTQMGVVRAHKGKLSQRCHVRGLECHSGLAHLGVNAVEAAAEVVAYLKDMARRFRDQGPYDPELSPPYHTVHTGIIHGGTALNIVPKECWFDFEFRCLPGHDTAELAKEVHAFAERSLLPEMHAVHPDTGFSWEPLSSFPGLTTEEHTEVAQLAKACSGANTTGKVSFGTEAGLFDKAGIPAVVCGPGSIEHAHKPNEYVSIEQVMRCEEFMDRLLDRLQTGL